MKKQLAIISLSLLMSISLSLNSFSAEKVEKNKSSEPLQYYNFKISENVLAYTPDLNTPYMQKQTKDLYANMVDPGKAMGLSALYFGLGQLYAGETTKGALILAGGTLLTGTVLLVLLPNLNQRPEGVTAVGYAISAGALGLAYILNIRDAYLTAESINKDINNKLLTSDNYLYHLEKVNISNKESTIGLTYNLKF